MKLVMTDGQSEITVHFCKQLDAKDYQRIAESKRPVSLALSIAKKAS